MGYIGKRTPMNKGRCPFQGLDKIWFQSILQYSCHCAFSLQVLCVYSFTIVSITNNNLPKSLLQVHKGRGQAEDCHDFTGYSNVKAIFPNHTILCSQTHDNMSQLPVVHIHCPANGNGRRIYTEFITLEYVVIHHGTEKIVCSFYGMEIAVEMEVYVSHWGNLCHATSCSPAFYSKDRPHTGFPKGKHSILPYSPQAVTKANCSGCLTFSKRSGSNCCNKNQFPVFFFPVIGEIRKIDLCFVSSVVLHVLFLDTCFPCDFPYFRQFD